MRAPWQSLSRPRQANLLRAWLRDRSGRGVPDTLVQRLLDEWPRAGSHATWPAGSGQVHVHAGNLQWCPMALPDRRADGTPLPASSQQPASLPMDLSAVGEHPVAAWKGRLIVESATTDGVPASLLSSAVLRGRAGGERFQFHPRSVARSLKKQFQAAGVDAGDRQGPLVFAGEDLVFVPGLGLDGRLRRAQGPDLRRLRWEADPR